MKQFIFSTIICMLLCWPAEAGTITLKTGQVIKGKITSITDEEIKIDIGVGFPITYYTYEIGKIGDFSLNSFGKENKDKSRAVSRTAQFETQTPKPNQVKKAQTESPKKFKTKLDKNSPLRPVAKNKFKPTVNSQKFKRED